MSKRVAQILNLNPTLDFSRTLIPSTLVSTLLVGSRVVPERAVPYSLPTRRPALVNGNTLAVLSVWSVTDTARQYCMLRSCSLSPVGACGWTPRTKPIPLIHVQACASFTPFQPARLYSASTKNLSSLNPQSAKHANLHDINIDSSLLPLYLSTFAWLPDSASAADSINYTPGEGADVVKNVAGVAYVALLGFWLFKVIGRRIKRSTTERLANERDPDADEQPMDEDSTEVTAGAAALGAIQASFFTYLLFLFSTNISKYFGGQDMPDQYTARNITVTIRTAVGGLAYLATFIFGANALGLAGLTLKLTFFPDAIDSTSKDVARQKKDDSLL